MKPKIPSRYVLKKYGLTAEQYVLLWDAQGGRCAICDRRFTPSRPACVDHDHKTFKVRGLLCGPDNYELGCLHDDAEWLENAASYLRWPTAGAIWKKVPLVAGAPVRQNDKSAKEQA